MDRRMFIKNTLITTAGLAITGATFAKTVPLNNKENKQMKILVLTGSARKNGNSNTLVDNFIKGAEEKGHKIFRFDAAFKKVHPCIGCNACGMNGDCIFQDDFNFVKENILDSDMLVFATPMYYFGISTQLKAVIDRFHSMNAKIHIPKKAALFLTYAGNSEASAQPIKTHYDVLLNYLGWQDVGQIIAPGVQQAGAINDTKYVKQAYELGKSL